MIYKKLVIFAIIIFLIQMIPETLAQKFEFPSIDRGNEHIYEYGIHASTSWWDGEKEHIRVYTQEADGKPKEYCWDSNGWYLGGFTNIAEVNPIAATSWWDGEKEHIRVYTQGDDGKPKEYCWDSNGWYISGFTDNLS